MQTATSPSAAGAPIGLLLNNAGGVFAFRRGDARRLWTLSEDLVRAGGARCEP